MRRGAVVVRRFTSRATGREEVTELARAIEIGIPPTNGMRLVFDEVEVSVSIVRYRCGLAPVRGVVPPELELLCCKESAAGLEAALAAGWQPVTQAAPVPAGSIER